MSKTFRVEGIEEAQDLLKGLGKAQPFVLSRALNRTLRNFRTFTARGIGKEVNLKAAKIKEDISENKANPTNLSASLTLKGKPVGFRHFGAKQTKKGVSVRIRKKKPREATKGAFRLKNTKRLPKGRMTAGTFWKRVGKPRTPLAFLAGPRIPSIVAENPALLNDVEQFGADALLKNVKSQVDRELAKLA